MLMLYGDPISGNAYKARSILRLTGWNFQAIALDTLKGETCLPNLGQSTRTAKF